MGGPAENFARLARTNFSRWDLNHDGSLSNEELNQALLDPSIHGADAACLACLKHYAAPRAKTPIAWTATALDQASQAGEGQGDLTGESPDEVVSLRQCGGLFKKYETKIAGAVHKLYANQTPHRELIVQGAMDDCYLLSNVGALISQDPKLILAMVQSEPDGGTRVNLPGQAPIRLKPPTDAEIALYASGVEDGYWLLQLSKAYGGLVEGPKARQEGLDSEEVTGGGGNGPHTYHILTGLTMNAMFFQGGTAHHSNKYYSLAEIRQALEEGTRSRKIMLVATGPKAIPRPRGIPTGHAMAIIGYDSNTRRVRIWNPWGNNLDGHGGDRMKSGYPTSHGLFEMPLEDMFKYCTAVDIQATSYADPFANHPHYLKALDLLRLAQAHIVAAPGENSGPHLRNAATEVEGALGEIHSASIDDQKGNDDPLPLDPHQGRRARLKRAIALLKEARHECQQASSQPHLKERVLRHIDTALGHLSKEVAGGGP